MIRRVTVAVLLVLGSLAVASPALAVDPPLDDARQVEGGELHTCAVTSDNKALCWGDSTYGQVGFGNIAGSGVAVPVFAVDGSSFLSSVRQVTAGGRHSCAVLLNNQARCWGDNTYGQLGSGGPSIDHAAVVLNGPGTGPLTGVRSIGAGYNHTCALLVSGQVRCWGFNNGGQLGDGTTTGRPRPVGVRSTNGTAPLTDAVQLSVGAHHACVTLESGQARCWGVGEHGRIGDGTQIDRKRAVVVRNETGRGPLTGVRQVVAGGTHTCALVSGGQVRCWGLNAAHQLGTQGPATQRLLPVIVRVRTGSQPPFTGAVALGTANNTTCAVLASGQVRCWGDDGQAELGNGPATGQIGPVAVRSPAGGIDPPPGPGNLTGITQVGGGGDHLCARRANGRAYCWGANGSGQIGFGSNNDPVHRPTSVLRAT